MSPRTRHARRTIRQLGAWLALVFTVSGCGGGSPSPSPASGAPAATAAIPAMPAPVAKPTGPQVLPKEPEPAPLLPPLTYEPNGRRDPFTPVSLAREKTGMSVNTMKLSGVIRGRTLLALVEAADGIGYILHPGDVLGDGRVTDITPASVTFAVAAKPGQSATTLTLRLPGD